MGGGLVHQSALPSEDAQDLLSHDRESRASSQLSENEEQINDDRIKSEIKKTEEMAWRKWTEVECETILEKNCLDNRARFRLAQIWIDNEESMDDATKLLESIQKSVEPNFMEAEILMLLGDRLFSNSHKDYKRALEFYQQASKLMPNSAICFTKLGLVYERLREFDQAIDCYKRACRRDSSAFVPLMRLGLVYIRNNLKEKGLKQLLLAYE